MGNCGKKPPMPQNVELESLVKDGRAPLDPKPKEAQNPLVIAAGVCCGSCCCLMIIVMIVAMYVGWVQVAKSQNMDSWHDPSVPPPDFPRYMGCSACNAGKKTDEEIEKCASPCPGLKFVKEWEEFAQKHPYKLVYFPSRKGPQGEPPVNISAWWLPADPSLRKKGATAPRVVAMHGLASNANHCGVQSACWHLRAMGFSCLTPTVRDYGLSGKSTHPDTMTWGYDYPSDLLGAWDYAVNDPDGKLGGALSPGKVGIMGFSKGAYVAGIAYNLERKIPGAWIDSAPWLGLEGMVDMLVRPYVGFIATPLREAIVWWANYFAGLPLDMYRPYKMFMNCTAPARKIFIHHGTFDTSVPIRLSNWVMDLLGGLPQCYDLDTYTPPDVCNGATHHVEFWKYPDDTRKKLCGFWSKVFEQDEATCGLSKLTKLQKSEAQDDAKEDFKGQFSRRMHWPLD